MARPKKVIETSSENKLTVDNENKDSTIIKRRKRIRLTDQSRLMRIPNKDESRFMYRIENDVGDNISRLLDAGWDILDRQGKPLDRDVRTQDPSWRHSALSQPVGNNTIAYAMCIPREDWEEDQMAQEEELLKLERGYNRIQNVSSDKVYGDVKIDHSLK